MAEGNYQVKVERGKSDKKSYKIPNDTLVLGAGPEADIIVTGKGVAPRHAQITFEAGAVKLEDLGTQSGTFRNGQRLLGPVQVFPGDRIGLGPRVVLILEGDDPKSGAAEGSLADTLNKAMDGLADDLGLGTDTTEEA